MATAYRAPPYLSCSARLLRCRNRTDRLPNLLLSGELTRSSVFISKKKKKIPSAVFFCSFSNAPEVITACSWNEAVLCSDTPVLVEFWASWCGPCKVVSRVMDEIAHEYGGRIKCCRINADEHPQVCASHGVEKVPTVLLFKDAEKTQSFTGTMPKSVYVTAVERSLS